MRLTKVKKIPFLRKIAIAARYPYNVNKRHELYDKYFAKHKKDTKHFCLNKNFDCKSIPVFIVSFNRLSYLKQMVDFLEKYGFTNIHIVDNQSAYKPLIKYLKNSPHHVHFMDKNYGHRVVWESGYFKDIINQGPYIVTDPDIGANKKLPSDFCETLYKILGKHPFMTKVGFALDIFDLPKTKQSKQVVKWESKFWQDKVDGTSDVYWADLDTTFSLYRPGDPSARFYDAIRVGGNFTAKHLPWYGEKDSAEKKFYMNTASSSASWIKNTTMYE